MKLARVLALCARSTGITGSNVISTQLPAAGTRRGFGSSRRWVMAAPVLAVFDHPVLLAGACAISTLRCLPSALAAHAEGMHLQQSAVMQFVLQQQDLSGLISSRHFASLVSANTPSLPHEAETHAQYTMLTTRMLLKVEAHMLQHFTLAYVPSFRCTACSAPVCGITIIEKQYDVSMTFSANR